MTRPAPTAEPPDVPTESLRQWAREKAPIFTTTKWAEIRRGATNGHVAYTREECRALLARVRELAVLLDEHRRSPDRDRWANRAWAMDLGLRDRAGNRTPLGHEVATEARALRERRGQS